MLHTVPQSIQDYIMCFFPLNEYNPLCTLIKIKPNYAMYFKVHTIRKEYVQNLLRKYEIYTTVKWNCINDCRYLINLNLIKYLYEEKLKIPPCIMDAACRVGNLPLVKFLHEVVNVNCTSDAMDDACLNSHLNIVNNPGRLEGQLHYMKSYMQNIQNVHLLGM